LLLLPQPETLRKYSPEFENESNQTFFQSLLRISFKSEFSICALPRERAKWSSQAKASKLALCLESVLRFRPDVRNFFRIFPLGLDDWKTASVPSFAGQLPQKEALVCICTLSI